MEYLSCIFDKQLDMIKHYQNYPEMRPWIGCNYAQARIKLLLVGESHYLEINSTYHHDPIAWYEGMTISDKDDWGWVKTRNIILNGIKTNWKSHSKAIYKNTEKALFESNFFDKKPVTAYTDVGFMNFFQRPAEVSGKSIKVSEIDAMISNNVFQDVVSVISPDIVIFTSSLAFNCAKGGNSLSFLQDKKIKYIRTPHPGMPWWNRVSKAYKNKTGRDHFIHFVNEQVQAIPA
jgi:hypothetical protein